MMLSEALAAGWEDALRRIVSYRAGGSQERVVGIRRRRRQTTLQRWSWNYGPIRALSRNS